MEIYITRLLFVNHSQSNLRGFGVLGFWGFGVLVGVLGVLFGVLGVLFGVLGVLVGILGVLVGVLGCWVGAIDVFGIVMLY